MPKSGVFPIGSRTFLYQVDCPFDLEHQRRFWSMAETLGQRDDVVEAVPGMTNVTIRFERVPNELATLERDLDALWATGDKKDLTGKVLEIDTTYGGAGGPHLQDVCSLTGLTVDEVVRLHCRSDYTVYAVGSHAGYCYLGGLDPRLETPRRKVPLKTLPGGSLSIAGLQTGVSASAGPSGWNTIGSADVCFFDPTRKPASLLRPGDQIRFKPTEVIA
ncbi:allophanate hydrolase [Thioclava sp. NG1]|uniref:5-oxoprolinase subunit PxpB n=1 Tax=Thioclava sp. NG1 TaxID=2182426 RepID=UPI000D619A7E|nr:5-oxoprolinase subunit PxpB [Thioclava sp. NG1]PWE48383.1 allophanate hydrolase [Thioclava sp. NG1]